MNISRKHVELDTRCPMCNRLNEDGGHLFLKCKNVKQVWRSLLLEDIRLMFAEAPNPMVMLDLLFELPVQKRLLASLLLWDWWSTRNKVNTEHKVRSTDEVCHIIQKHYAVFHGSDCTMAAVGSGPDQQMTRWSRPAQNFVKVNFDASFIESTKSGAWGFVVRSDTGEFIAAAAEKLKHLRNALQAETEACPAATEGASALGLHRVIFESDSQTLVHALQSKSHDLAEIGVLLREIRSECIGSFESFEFSFCPRSCNKVAHDIAQFGLRTETGCTGWADDAPEFVSGLIASEFAEQNG